MFPDRDRLAGLPGRDEPQRHSGQSPHHGPYRPGSVRHDPAVPRPGPLYQSSTWIWRSTRTRTCLGPNVVPTYLCPSCEPRLRAAEGPPLVAAGRSEHAVRRYRLQRHERDRSAFRRGPHASCRTTAASPNACSCGWPISPTARPRPSTSWKRSTSGAGLWIHGRPHYNQAAPVINSPDGLRQHPGFRSARTAPTCR